MTKQNKRAKVSFECFPPRTPALEKDLWKTITKLAPLNPDFFSVTYGAGGSTRTRTHKIAKQIINDIGQDTAAHLTCVNATREELNEIALDYWESGIRHIVALRGDPPAGQSKYVGHPKGYQYAVDLVRGLKRVKNFKISVAAYPETHPDAPDPTFDLENLKQKIDEGANQAITQFFFDNTTYLRFRDRAVAAGILVPIIPGIMPIGNFKKLSEFARLCGATLPPTLIKRFSVLNVDQTAKTKEAIMFASEQCLHLQDHGVNEFHFYTLNRSDLTRAICTNIGVSNPLNGATT